MASTTFAAYCDVNDYLFSGALGAIETASLIGGNTTTSGTTTAGATSVGLTATAGFSGTFTATILDGLQSERIPGCTISGSNLVVPAPGTAFSHAAGVNVASAGTQGDLADIIRMGSRTVENICRQGPDGGADRTLYAVARTEVLSGPTMARAHFDRDGSLNLRPYHFPVTGATSISVQMGAQTAVTIDTTFLVFPDGARRIWVPQPQVVGAQLPSRANWIGASWPRNYGFAVTLVYTGGACATAALTSVPDDVRDACHKLVSDIIAIRKNPAGAAMVRLGDQTLEARLRGDTTGRSILNIQARELLIPFTNMPM